MTNNLLASYLSYSRENQRLYRYILENSMDNERSLSYMVNRELENGRGRTFIRPRQNTIFRPVRSYNSERENNNQSRGPNVVQSNFFNPVSVSPTVEQINNNCTVLQYSDLSNEEKSQYSYCTITLNQFNENSNVMKINHCGHIFSEDGLRQHFNNSVRCPICRHDIRERTNSDSENESNSIISLFNALRSNSQSSTDLSGNSISVDLSNNVLHITYSSYA